MFGEALATAVLRSQAALGSSTWHPLVSRGYLAGTTCAFSEITEIRMQMKSCAPHPGLSAAVFLSEAPHLLHPDKTCPSLPLSARVWEEGEKPVTRMPGSSGNHEYPLIFP